MSGGLGFFLFLEDWTFKRATMGEVAVLGKEECMELPPGFRFHPTDEEIITHYLSEKVMNPGFTARAMGEVDLNKCEPWDLPGHILTPGLLFYVLILAFGLCFDLCAFFLLSFQARLRWERRNGTSSVRRERSTLQA